MIKRILKKAKSLLVIKIIRDKWKATLFENENPIYHLKTNSFSGNTKIKELNKKIEGVWGLKWATQLTDEKGNSLLKIRNDKQFIDNGKCIIQIEDENINPLEILISLYVHLFSSSLKLKNVMMGGVL